MGYAVNHGFDIHIDKRKFKEKIGEKTYKQFYIDMKQNWDLDISYPTFMNLLDNKIKWLLVYAYPVARDCGMQIEDLFVVVPVKKRENFVKVRRKKVVLID